MESEQRLSDNRIWTVGVMNCHSMVKTMAFDPVAKAQFRAAARQLTVETQTFASVAAN